MNARMDRAGFVKLAPARRRGRHERGVRGVVETVVHGVVTLAKIFSAAHEAAHLAERYYAMSDAELARLGLTRDSLRTELLRVLTVD